MVGGKEGVWVYGTGDQGKSESRAISEVKVCVPKCPHATGRRVSGWTEPIVACNNRGA